MIRRFALLAALAVTAAFVPTAATGAEPFPDVIELPDGFQPEGIDIDGSTFYVGSIPTGAIYRGDVRTGEGAVLVPAQSGRAAIGVEESGGLLWVAGGPTGHAFVYDAGTGDDVAAYELTTATATFVNDVVVTGDTAWFTDSQQPHLYRVDVDTGDVDVVPLTGDYVHRAGEFNLNGIDATPDGRTLIAVQSATGQLYAIDADTGEATLVDLGGATLANGDGLLLLGRTLYVVQNRLDQIAVVDLAADLLSGEVVATITDAAFRVPTTIARHGHRLYAVNARFGTTPTPATDYEVVSVPR